MSPHRHTHGELVVVTGMSGAGRSTAAKELEDLGYFVVDNLPPSLLAPAIALIEEQYGSKQSIAVVVDVRTGAFFGGLHEVLATGLTGRNTTLLFLDAADEVLVRRQEAVRRPHPLQGPDRLIDGLLREREHLSELRGDADLVIDTSNLNVHQLTERISDAFGTAESTALRVNVVSFGFKYGIPVDSDFVADMRFLPNPHWIPELRPRTGLDAEVSAYVTGQHRARDFLADYLPALRTAAHGALVEGKRFMTVAVGCTGGKHRSVAMAVAVGESLAQEMQVRVTHRDLGRE